MNGPLWKVLRRNWRKKLKLLSCGMRQQASRQVDREPDRPSDRRTRQHLASLAAERRGLPPLSEAIAAAPGRGASATPAASAIDAAAAAAARPATSGGGSGGGGGGGRDGGPSGLRFHGVAEIHLRVASSDYVNLMGRERIENEVSDRESLSWAGSRQSTCTCGLESFMQNLQDAERKRSEPQVGPFEDASAAQRVPKCPQLLK